MSTAAIQIKERPILFSGPMVRAILEGRKTQTRRIVKDGIPLGNWNETLNKCPYGKPGERLWVRETWAPVTIGYAYKADGVYIEESPVWKWKPSIHMPRVASRILLEITDIRVECLQEISEEDAKAEGLRRFAKFGVEEWGGVEAHPQVKNHFRWYDKPIEAFKQLWEHINGRESWKQNPWVWVVEFKMISNESSK